MKFRTARIVLLRGTAGVLLILSAIGCRAPLAAPDSLPAVDCPWRATVVAWRDDNRDGQRQPAEPSLEGVQIRIQGASALAQRGVTDQRGFAPIALHLWGCPDSQFTIRAIAPPGFRATTPAAVPVRYDLPQGLTSVHQASLNQQASIDPIPLGFGFVQQ
jgi:hypothetical protein